MNTNGKRKVRRRNQRPDTQAGSLPHVAADQPAPETAAPRADKILVVEAQVEMLEEQVAALTHIIGELAEERRPRRIGADPLTFDILRFPFGPSVPQRRGERPSRPLVRILLTGSLLLLLSFSVRYGFEEADRGNQPGIDLAKWTILVLALPLLGCVSYYFPSKAFQALVTGARAVWSLLRGSR